MAGNNSTGLELPAVVPATWSAWQPVKRTTDRLPAAKNGTSLGDRENLINCNTFKKKLIREPRAFREFRPKTGLFS